MVLPLLPSSAGDTFVVVALPPESAAKALPKTRLALTASFERPESFLISIF